MSHADDTDRLQLKRLITEAEKAGTVVQIPSIVARQFLEDSEWIAGQAELIQRLNERVAELERLYATRCRENIILQGQVDRFRAGLEKVRMILEGVESFGDGECDAEAVAMDLRDVLQSAGLEK